MEEFNFYRDNYLFEFEMKEKLEKSASSSIAVLVILGSIVSLFINEIRNIEFNYIAIIFLSLLSLSGLFFLLSLYFIIRALYNHEYMYMPTSSQLKKYSEELIDYYLEEENPKEKANKDLEEYIIGEYAVNAHTNFQNNGRKSAFIHLANTYIIVTIILLLLSSIPHYINNFEKDDHKKIEVINLNELKD